MTAPTELEIAEANAREARKELAASMSEVRERLAPKALVRLAGDRLGAAGSAIGAQTIGTARRHPAAIIGLGASALALIARRPIARVAGTLARIVFRRKPAPPAIKDSRYE